MQLATVRTDGSTCAARVDGDDLVVLDAADVGEVFGRGSSTVGESGVVLSRAGADLAPPVVRPGKVVCVGLNYRSHLVELGIPIPEYPTLFAKFASTLIGADDPLVLPTVSDKAIWEVELTVVIGRPVARGSLGVDEALGAIGGYTVANDVTMRDWQRRSNQWLAGKAFDATTPVGPVVVTPDEVDDARHLELVCEVAGEVRQIGCTDDLIFSPTDLVVYIAQFASLEPGDLILTGTPAGAGPDATHFLQPDQLLRSAIAGIGECRNLTVAGAP